jgi:hypothetical protein
MTKSGSTAAERRALQLIVAVASLVPICAGGAGALFGPAILDGPVGGAVEFDSHFRYLSGLLLAVGMGFASAVPHIERRRRRFLLLTGIVAIGGFARSLSILAIGLPSPPMIAALAMELIVTPVLALWQSRVARQAVARHTATASIERDIVTRPSPPGG